MRSLAFIAVLCMAVASASATPTVVPQSFIASGYATPTALSGQVDDYSINAIEGRLDCSTGPGVCVITGLAGCTFDGRIIILTNISKTATHDITLNSEDPASLPEDRLVAADDVSIVIGPGRSSALRCDAVALRWRPLASENGNLSARQLIGTEQTITDTGDAYALTLNASTTVLKWQGTSTLQLRGIVGGTPGRFLWVLNESPNVSVMFLDDEDLGAQLTDRIWGSGGRNITLRGESTTGGSSNGSNATLLYYSSNRWKQFNALTQHNDPLILNTSSLIMWGTSFIDTSAGTAPSLSSCGSASGGGPTITGSNAGGRIVTGGSNTGCVITFAVPSLFGGAPNCTVTAESATATLGYVADSAKITITMAANSNNVIHYNCQKAHT